MHRMLLCREEGVYIGKNKETLFFYLVAIVFIIGFIYYLIYIKNNWQSFISYFAGLATITIALLTAVYVIITSSQLKTMQTQLEEMKIARMLQSQPLPFLTFKRCYIERPNVFKSPPEWLISIQYRLFMAFKIKNIGIGPAICIDVVPKLLCKHKANKYVETPVSERIEVLEERIESEECHFMFAIDTHHCCLNAINGRKIDDYPILKIKLYYKNMVGGIFSINVLYRLYPYDNHREEMKSMLKSLLNFGIDYEREIEQHNNSLENNEEKALEIFGTLRENFDKHSTSNNLEFALRLIPGTFKVKRISEHDYKEIVEREISYGKILRVLKPKDENSTEQNTNDS